MILFSALALARTNMAVIFIMAMFAFVAASTARADPWAYSVSIGVDPHVGLAAEPYQSGASGGGISLGVDLEDAPYEIDNAMQLAVTAERRFDALGWNWEPTVSASFVLRRAAVTFPEGLLILVDPLQIRSQSIGVDVRASLVGPQTWDRVSFEGGVGSVFLRIMDRVDYGFLQAENKRGVSLPYAFGRVDVPVFRAAGANVSAYAEAHHSRLDTSWAIGLEHEF